MGLLALKRLVSKWRSSRFVKNQVGVAAIEFAILGPIFGVAFFVTFETGFILYTEYVMQTAVQEAARLVRTGRVHINRVDPSGVKPAGLQWDAAAFKKSICFIAGRVSHCEDRLTVYMQTATSFKALKASTPAYLSIGPNTYTPNADGSPAAPFSCGQSKDAVALIATYDWELHLPIFMSNFANLPGDKKRRIVAFAMFRNEPYPGTTAATSCKASTPAPKT